MRGQTRPQHGMGHLELGQTGAGPGPSRDLSQSGLASQEATGG